jgi:spermidine/putrescine transport system ATP-binding protein
VASFAVELRDVGKRFGSVVALDGVDLAIRKGEFFSLLGPSGCGKTTTLNLIGGFETASRGTLLIDGQPMGNTPSHARPVNTVFQSYALFPHMSVADNVGFGLRMKKVPRPERRRAVEEMLRLVSLEGFEERRPSQLSGGQRQRVALARALVNHPSVLLLDEPLGALDLKLRTQMQAELTRLQRKVGITFVYVTHDQDEALSMSDRIAVMDRGRVLQVGTPAEIYGDPADRFVMEFIGSPNVFTGRVERLEAGGAAVAVPGVGSVRAGRAAEVAVGAAAAVLIRPERVRIAAVPPVPDGRPGSPSAPLAGHIAKIADLGFISHYFIRLADGREVLSYRLNALADGGAVDRFEEGQRVYLWWEEQDARAFAEGVETQTARAPSHGPGTARRAGAWRDR